MIKNRAKQQRKASLKKPVSNTDQSIARSRAKRSAAVAARRGLQASKKPTAMQIDTEVKKQVAKSAKQQQAVAKKKGKHKSAMKGSGKEKAEQRKEVRSQAQAVARLKKGDAKVKGMGVHPSKKHLNAAVNAMAQKGFQIPAGVQMVVSFEPAPGGQQQQQQQKGQQQSQKGDKKPAALKGGKKNNRRGGGGKK
jgi:hypothetical protein